MMILIQYLDYIMYDRFIERLTVSAYKDNFILKGGFYLSTLFGIENRATINIKLENIKESFSIDIATGDPITPKAINYKYFPTLGDKHINLWAYNIETVLAEKLETILSRVEASSRTRDYYDIYLIYKMNIENINQEYLKRAVEKTFEKRKYDGDIINTLTKIKDSEILKNRWKSYSKKNSYAKDVSYEDVIECLEALVRVIEPVTV